MLADTPMSAVYRPKEKGAKTRAGIEIALALCFVLGLSVGSVYIMSAQDSISAYIKYISVGALESAAVSGWWRVFALELLPKLAFAATVSLMGMCAVGSPFIFLLTAAFGCGCGAFAAWTYTALAAKGLLFNLVAYGPAQLVFVLFVFSLGERGVRLSSALFRSTFFSADEQLSLKATVLLSSLLKTLAATAAGAAYYAFMCGLVGDILA